MSSVYSNMKMKFGNKLKVPWLSTTASQKRQGKDKQVEAPTKKDALMGLQNLPQPQLTRFEGANPWQPEEHVVLYCMNNQDNVPARMKLDNEFVYYISQSRSPGHKDQGQDCMSSAKHKDWEVHVLCDGHDKLGHMVALGVCQQLPKIVLRMIHERENAGAVVADSLLANAFDECAKVVCWTSEGITVGIWVKVFEGQWADKPGYIKESTGAGKVRVAIIDENGYHLPPIDRKSLRRPRYTGGCTCVCLVRNRVTNEWKVAVSGDSRSVIMPCKGVNDAVLLRQAGVVTESSTKPIPEGLITPAHNVFNVDERDRLEKSYPGQYEVDGNFLVNPITKFAIQPTRGFGDFDMFGTGYTHVPQISKTFKLEPNSLIFTASDGVFDTHVWQDEEIVSCLDKYIEEGLTSAQIVENMYRETLQRSLEGGYVDDISIFCYKTPGDASVKEKEELTEELVVPNPTLIKKRKDTKDKRRTIGRNGDSYTDLSTQVLELKKKKMNISKDAVDMEDEKLDNLAKDDKEAEATVEGVGRLMKNIAIAQGLDDFKGVDPKDLASGRSFSAGDGSNDDGEENFNAAEP